MFFSENRNKAFLAEVRKGLQGQKKPKRVKDILCDLIENEKPKVPELSGMTKNSKIDIFGIVDQKIKIQQRKLAINSFAGVSFSTLAICLMSISYFGWGYVRDTFRNNTDMANSLNKVEQASQTGLSGGVSDFNTLLLEDPFLT
ncbi:hypothetical protein CL659_00575 [bacterium]|nr:hypothetical protein [bacterium]|tara:strand:+ start:189 stop:620 length:432 start_codon:yes stop_codon:yes gene_type:complete